MFTPSCPVIILTEELVDRKIGNENKINQAKPRYDSMKLLAYVFNMSLEEGTVHLALE